MADSAKKKKDPPRAEAEVERKSPGDLARFVRSARFGLPIATIAAAALVGSIHGVGTAILVLAGGVLLGVIAILWASVRTLSGEAPLTLDEAIALGAPSA